MSTMKDVARLAGVSVATVSCHLSGAKPVKPATRMKIDQAIKQLKYVPNSAARQLKKANTKTVGVIIPDFSEHLYSEIFRGITEYLQSRNIIVNIVFSFSNAKIEQHAIYNFTHQNVSGLILITCQPENKAFFERWLNDYNIPTVFCLNRVNGIESPFIDFDNYRAAWHIAESLLENGIDRQLVIGGDDRFSPEADFLRGVRDAYAAAGRSFPPSQRYITNMTKENAFKVTMQSVNTQTMPEAFLCTSEQIAKGVLEALSAMKFKIPEDILVITLGEDSWNKTDSLHRAISTTRSAVDLGQNAAELLQECIRDSSSTACREIHLTDRFTSTPLKISNHTHHAEPRHLSNPSARPLRMLIFLGTITGFQPSLKCISHIFLVETGIPIEFIPISLESVDSSSTLRRIRDNISYDMIVYDMPFKEDFIYQGLISEITDLIERPDFKRDRLLNCDWQSYFHRGRCYGFPIINGAQTLFYRKDLFENQEIMSAYYNTYNVHLRPPRTWKEYSRVAGFFTRELNPASPTQWGIAEMDYDNGSLIAQNTSRFFSAGGNFWNENGVLQLDTPENRKALAAMLEPYRYCRGKTFNPKQYNAVDIFCSGESAMCIAFNDGATTIRDAINRQQIGQLGYARPPEGHSIRAGWGLGLHPDTPCREEVYSFFKWFIRTDISYYYTILSGNTTSKLPYENNEILSLYPWMKLFPHGEVSYSKRLAHSRPSGVPIVSHIVMERVFSDVIRQLLANQNSIDAILAEAQEKMAHAFINPQEN